MAIINTRFPDSISYGSAFGPGHETTIIEVESGAEERIIRRRGARRIYDVGKGIATLDDLHTAYKIIVALEGAGDGCLFKDWLDFASTTDGRTNDNLTGGGGAAATSHSDQTIGTGDGVTQVYQLTKTYSFGNKQVVRNINYPVSGTVKIGFNGVNQPTGWSVNTTTGEVTFTSAPGLGVLITAGYEFDVAIRLSKEADLNTAFSIEAYRQGTVSIPMIELIDERPVPEEFNFGGSLTIDPMTEDISITRAQAQHYLLNPTNGTRTVFLPGIEGYGTGGPGIFLIENLNATNSITLLDDQAGAVHTITPSVPDVWVNLVDLGNNTVVWQVIGA